MPRMRMAMLAGLLAAAAFGVAETATGEQQAREYVVVFERGTSADAGRDAVEAAGGEVTSVNEAIGVATVQARGEDFAANAAAQEALAGAVANQAIGRSPKERLAERQEIERLDGVRSGPRPKAGRDRSGKAEPLADRQWDMAMIGATADGSYARQQGSKKVRVGIMDTGIDASHPDIAPNFDRRLSRNFTVDDPLVDGACDTDPDGYCQDPADVDENGHGTHVAGTIGGALNGLGIGGVAPEVSLVNLRAGQDSGYFFLAATLDALTYAGDNGIDVVNMSFYIDPWLYNCAANPADSESEQQQQQLIIEATQRALGYARDRGVTLVSSAGNGFTDKGKPVEDSTSPDYPPGNERTRAIDNSCLTLPSEGNGVIGVTALGPSERKSYYSDYGLEQADVSAPGGDAYDYPNPVSGQPRAETQVLAPYPEALLREAGALNPDGSPKSPSVVRDCKGKVCGYYRYLQGTSMASPHAAGVAALAVAQFGEADGRGGVGLAADRTEQLLLGTAQDRPCPEQNPYVYPARGPQYTATCEGTPQRNGFYGDGIVDAERILIGR